MLGHTADNRLVYLFMIDIKYTTIYKMMDRCYVSPWSFQKHDYFAYMLFAYKLSTVSYLT